MKSAVRDCTVGGLMAATVLCGLVGCSSEPRSTLHDIPVTLTFENLRRQPGLDEWIAVSGVLAHHTDKPIRGEPFNSRTSGDVTIRDYRVEMTLPSMATVDAIHTELKDLENRRFRDSRVKEKSLLETIGLSSGPDSGHRIELALANVGLTYRSNYVTAAVTVSISGTTTPGSLVKLYVAEGREPVSVTAPRTGFWIARIDVLPQTEFIYGSSEDPKGGPGKLPTKYFRMSIHTLQQEPLSEADFQAQRPKSK